MPSARLAAMVVFMTSSGWPSVVTSNMFIPAPTNKLLNLIGFFSIFCLGSSCVKAISRDMLYNSVIRSFRA